MRGQSSNLQSVDLHDADDSSCGKSLARLREMLLPIQGASHDATAFTNNVTMHYTFIDFSELCIFTCADTPPTKIASRCWSSAAPDPVSKIHQSIRGSASPRKKRKRKSIRIASFHIESNLSWQLHRSARLSGSSLLETAHVFGLRNKKKRHTNLHSHECQPMNMRHSLV